MQRDKEQGYVYCLHFDEPLAHARHYVGCTCNPRDRLITHALGQGANLVKHVLASGGGFRLGALGVTHIKAMRRIERQVKNWHGPAEFCEICHPGDSRAMPGTQPYPLESIRWPLDSASLAALKPGGIQVEYVWTDRNSPLAYVTEIKYAMRHGQGALGFIPCGGLGGINDYMAAGKMIMARVDNALAGYCLYSLNPTWVTIQQCFVEEIYRGMGIGKAMVEMVATKHADHHVQCRVRDDLHANEFWQHIGFKLLECETHTTSGNQLNHYTREAKNANAVRS